MPTIGTTPSLQTTQAVGAILLHQFARERFAREGIDERLIHQAEVREHLDDLTAPLLHTSSSCSDSNRECESVTSANDESTNSLSSNTTILGTSTDNYHSMVDSLAANDRTLYHSMTAPINSTTDSTLPVGDASTISTSPLDRLQSSPTLASYGRELRRIADEFEKSRLRQTLKERADQVDLKDISRESFVHLLEELFQDKITREKIVILFFFCTDVALRAVTFTSELVIKLMGWSFSYIINKVCNLVHQLGGWDRVLFYQLPSILISCVAALAICSLIVFLKKSIRT